MDDYRNKNGQFTKGYGGGPGRPKKESPEIIEPDEFKKIIARGLRSKNGKEQAVWARVKLAYDKQMGTSKDDAPLLDPVTEFILHFVLTFFAHYESKTGEACTGREALRIVCEHLDTCPDSPLRRNDFIEVEDDD